MHSQQQSAQSKPEQTSQALHPLDAEAAVLRRVEILLCRRIFAVVGIHSARAVKILRCIVEPAASLLSRALEIVPLCRAILLGNSVEQNEGILYSSAAYLFTYIGQIGHIARIRRGARRR